MSEYLTKELWRVIGKKIIAITAVPDWVKKIAMISFAILKDRSSVIGHEVVAAELKYITESYLCFLKEQVELNVRGPEWSTILKERLKAIEPYKNNDLIFVSISDGSNQFYIRFTPSSEFNVVHWEIF